MCCCQASIVTSEGEDRHQTTCMERCRRHLWRCSWRGHCSGNILAGTCSGLLNADMADGSLGTVFRVCCLLRTGIILAFYQSSCTVLSAVLRDLCSRSIDVAWNCPLWRLMSAFHTLHSSAWKKKNIAVITGVRHVVPTAVHTDRRHPVSTKTEVFFIRRSTRSCCQTAYYWTSRLPCHRCSHRERPAGRYHLSIISSHLQKTTKLHLFQLSYPGLVL